MNDWLEFLKALLCLAVVFSIEASDDTHVELVVVYGLPRHAESFLNCFRAFYLVCILGIGHACDSLHIISAVYNNIVGIESESCFDL